MLTFIKYTTTFFYCLATFSYVFEVNLQRISVQETILKSS